MIDNTQVVPATGPYKYPTSVTVTCMSGFNLYGGSESYTIDCLADGTWSRNESCIRKQKIIYKYVVVILFIYPVVFSF